MMPESLVNLEYEMAAGCRGDCSAAPILPFARLRGGERIGEILLPSRWR